MCSNPSSSASRLCSTVLGTRSPRPTPEACRRLLCMVRLVRPPVLCVVVKAGKPTPKACSTGVAGGRRLRLGAPGRLEPRCSSTSTATTARGTHVSLTQQVQQVHDRYEQLALALGEAAIVDLFKRSVFFVSIRSNDFIHYYLRNVTGVQMHYLPWEFSQLLVNAVRQEIMVWFLPLSIWRALAGTSINSREAFMLSTSTKASTLRSPRWTKIKIWKHHCSSGETGLDASTTLGVWRDRFKCRCLAGRRAG